MAKLRLHSPASFPGIGSEILIPGDDVIIGRGPEAHIALPEPGVSTPKHMLSTPF